MASKRLLKGLIFVANTQRTSIEWAELLSIQLDPANQSKRPYRVTVIDPDGWDREKFKFDVLAPVDFDEFMAKLLSSTLVGERSYLFNLHKIRAGE